MENPLPLFVLIASLAPLTAAAQISGPPGYTFGGMFGGNDYAVPQGYMNQGQSPFMTMPAPQYPFANPQFPSAPATQAAPFPANTPSPFWMQTPASPQPNARYITDIPTNVPPRTVPPSYTVFAAPGFSAAPPRWAPLPGQAPIAAQPQRQINRWSNVPNGGQPAPAVPATPPKWPTP